MNKYFTRGSLAFFAIAIIFIFSAFVNVKPAGAQSMDICQIINFLISSNSSITSEKAALLRASFSCDGLVPVKATLNIDFVSKAIGLISTGDSDNERAVGNFKFKATAVGGDVSIPKNIGRNTINVIKDDVQVGKVNNVSLSSSMSQTGDFYVIPEGETQLLTLSYAIDPIAGAGAYSAEAIFLPLITGEVILDGENNQFISDYIYLSDSVVSKPKPAISLSASSEHQYSGSAITIKSGDTLTISGMPQNLQGLSYYSGSGHPTSGYYSAAWFFDPIFNDLCRNTEPVTDKEWTMTCRTGVSGTGNFHVEIYANGEVYSSNIVSVTVENVKPTTSISVPLGGTIDLARYFPAIVTSKCPSVPTERFLNVDPFNVDVVVKAKTEIKADDSLSINERIVGTLVKNTYCGNVREIMKAIPAGTILATIPAGRVIQFDNQDTAGVSTSATGKISFEAVAATSTPSVTISSPVGGTTVGSTFTASGLCNAYRGNVSVYYYSDQKINKDVRCTDGRWSADINLQTNAGRGTFTLYAVLSSGQQATVSLPFIIDQVVNKPPVIKNTSILSTLYVNQPASLSITAYDPENGTINYGIDWGDNTNDNKVIARSSNPIQNYAVGHKYLEAGEYTITISIQDEAGLKADKQIAVKVIPERVVCTSFNYSPWSTCAGGTQTRTLIATSTESSCVGGNPVLSQSCTVNVVTCSSFTYSSWGACSSAGSQSRTVTASAPANCTGGTKVLSQKCTPPPPSNPSCGQLGGLKGYPQSELRCLPSSCPGGFTNLGKTYDCNLCCGGRKTSGAEDTTSQNYATAALSWESLLNLIKILR